MKQQQIILLILLIFAGVFLWQTGFLVKQSVYYERTTVPCTYSGCENVVQCPSGYTKTGCEVPGNCDCQKTVSCSVDKATLPNQCGTQQTVWECDTIANIWTFTCQDIQKNCGWHCGECIDRNTLPPTYLKCMVMPPEGYNCVLNAISNSCEKVAVTPTCPLYEPVPCQYGIDEKTAGRVDSSGCPIPPDCNPKPKPDFTPLLIAGGLTGLLVVILLMRKKK